MHVEWWCSGAGENASKVEVPFFGAALPNFSQIADFFRFDCVSCRLDERMRGGFDG